MRLNLLKPFFVLFLLLAIPAKADRIDKAIAQCLNRSIGLIPTKNLDEALALGSKLFLNRFEDDFVHFVDIHRGGKTSGKMIEIKDTAGRSFILKQRQGLPEWIIKEYQMLSALHDLQPKLFPETHLIRVKNSIFVGTKKVPGLNVKDLLWSDLNPQQIDMLSKMAGKTFSTTQEAKAEIARKILASPEFGTKIQQVRAALNQLQLSEDDFQFIFSFEPGSGKLLLTVLDVEYYFPSCQRECKGLTIQSLIENLEKVAAGASNGQGLNR